MTHRTAVCPACGAPVEFKVGTALVTICEFCNSAVARTDKEVADFGKVADIIPTDSRLKIGLTGRFSKRPFTVVGRVQYSHPAGGVWDEWYLAFPGNRWGWLAEAQGKKYLMFQRKLTPRMSLPDFDRLNVGVEVRFGKSSFTVNEKGVARNASAEGDIPWNFHPGGEHRFVDLSGPDATFATFEYGDPNHAYVGKQVSYDDLSLDGDDWQVAPAEVEVAAAQLNCPQCGGTLTLHVPDKTERVTCQNCNSLLDASNGKLEYFSTIQHVQRLPILLPLGSSGTLRGNRYLVIGFLGRFARYQGTTYPWNEYLLYNRDSGFRWLVQNDRHWSFVEPIEPHAVGRGMSTAMYQGTEFAIYDRGVAYVRHVLGEFYWRVRAGDKVRTADYIAPPRMISYEIIRTDQSEEVNVSLGTYLTVDEVEEAFGVKELPRPWGVGTIQPRPDLGYGVFGSWIVFLLVLLFIQACFSGLITSAQADPWLMFYGIIFVSVIPAGILFYYHSFEVRRWQDSDYSPYATDD